jgi:hypothetical protein
MSTELTESIDRITAGWSSARFWQHIQYLSEFIGPRPSGSTAERNAAVYASNELESYGLEVEIEEFDAYVDRPILTALELLEPFRKTFVTESLAWSADTDLAGVTGEIVDVGHGSEADFDRAPTRVSGKVVLARAGKIWRGAAIKFAEEAGALGLIWVSAFPGFPISSMGTSAVHIGNPLPTTAFPRLPGIGVSAEDGALLSELAARGAATVRIRMRRAREWVRSQNVVARIPGHRYPEQQVTLGAHLDQWSCGAYDSGSQIAELLELAKAITEAGVALDRTVVLCCWGAHEHGAIGSLDYTHNRHADEVARNVVGHINVSVTVGGRGQPRGVLRTHTSPEIRHLTESLVQHYGWGDGWSDESPYWDLSDHIGFFMRGIPSSQPRGWYLGAANPYYHSAAGDTFRNVNEDTANALDMTRLIGGQLLYLTQGPVPPIRYGAFARELAAEAERLDKLAEGRCSFLRLAQVFTALARSADEISKILDPFTEPQLSPSQLTHSQRTALEGISSSYVAHGKTLATAIYDLDRARRGEQIFEGPNHDIGLLPAFLPAAKLSQLRPGTGPFDLLISQIETSIDTLEDVVVNVTRDLTRQREDLQGALS